MSTEHERVARIVNATGEERAELQRVAASMALSLPDFLLARIAEDEDVALAAAGWDRTGRERAHGHWRRDGLNSVVDSERQSVIYGDGGPPGDAQVDHITRHDPARVLAECQAKRQIVEHYLRAVEADDRDKRRVMAGGYPHPEAALLGQRDLSTLEPVVHLLALPYADHPDYDPAWRP